MRLFVVLQSRSALGRLTLRFLDHTQSDTHILNRNPLQEWSSRRRGRYLDNTRDEYPCRQRDSNPRFQEKMPAGLRFDSTASGMFIEKLIVVSFLKLNFSLLLSQHPAIEPSAETESLVHNVGSHTSKSVLLLLFSHGSFHLSFYKYLKEF
jgi:hypothetical protein